MSAGLPPPPALPSASSLTLSLIPQPSLLISETGQGYDHQLGEPKAVPVNSI